MAKHNRNRKYRRVVSEVLGRKLRSFEVVHHINGNHEDNRNFNLLVCSKEYHQWLHFTGRVLFKEIRSSENMEEGLRQRIGNRHSYVGSCMSLAEAKEVVREIKERFGWTEVNEIRTGNHVQFYQIAIKLKVSG